MKTILLLTVLLAGCDVRARVESKPTDPVVQIATEPSSANIVGSFNAVNVGESGSAVVTTDVTTNLLKWASTGDRQLVTQKSAIAEMWYCTLVDRTDGNKQVTYQQKNKSLSKACEIALLEATR